MEHPPKAQSLQEKIIIIIIIIIIINIYLYSTFHTWNATQSVSQT